MFCPRCGLKQPSDHRFCISCGTYFPRTMFGGRGPKVSRWFWSTPVAEADNPHAALRVSRYLEERVIESPEGSVRIPGHHVRFSIWVEDRAVSAISLPDHEAEALGEFLLSTVNDPNGVEDLTANSR